MFVFYTAFLADGISFRYLYLHIYQSGIDLRIIQEIHQKNLLLIFFAYLLQQHAMIVYKTAKHTKNETNKYTEKHGVSRIHPKNKTGN